MILKSALISKNKLGFINGTILKPDVADQLFPIWQQCNNMVTNWIRNSTISSVSQSVMWITSAKEVWEDLVERFSNIDCFRLSDLLAEFHALGQTDKSVLDYCTALKILWDEISIMRPIPQCNCAPRCLCGGAMALSFQTYLDNEYVIKFLRGLNDEYESVRSQIFLLVPLPNIKAAFAMVMKFERQRHHLVAKNSMVLLNRSSSFPRSPGFQSGSKPFGGQFQGPRHDAPSHPSSAPRFYGNSSVRPESANFSPRGDAVAKHNGSFAYGPRPQCSYCGLLGHTEDKCYRKVGFPPEFQQKKRVNATEGVGDDDLLPSSVDNSSTAAPSLTGFTSVQLDQLMHLFGQSQIQQTPSTPSHQVNQTLVSDFNNSQASFCK